MRCILSLAILHSDWTQALRLPAWARMNQDEKLSAGYAASLSFSLILNVTLIFVQNSSLIIHIVTCS